VAASERYLKVAGSNAGVETILIQSYYLEKDYANAARVQQSVVESAIKAGKIPTESQLQLLAACQTAMKDTGGATHSYILLAKYYPKPDYWAQLLHGLITNPKIPGSLQLDVYRIRLAAGTLSAPADFMDMTELAMQAGLPQLALNLMNQGYALGALGKDAGAAREARLKALVVKTVEDKKASAAADEAAAAQAPSSNALIVAGYNEVTFGNVDKGLDLIKQGIAKGVLDPDGAKLHLGLAQMDGGRKADALATLKSVGGTNGASDIAQLWIIKLSSPSH
jgi:hypothetical protein